MNGFTLKVTDELLANEGIHEGDTLVCRYDGPLEDGRLYVYKVQEGAVGVGTLGLQPSLYMFSDAYSKRAFVPSEIYILGRVKASMRVVDH